MAVLTECWFSAPRRPGARFARAESGSVGGNVSAGCVEADLALRLDAVLADGRSVPATYGISDATAAGVGLSCGGTIELQLEAWEPDNPIWPALFTQLDARAPVILVTDLEARLGAHWLLDASGGVIASDVAGPPPEGVLDVGRQLLVTGGVRVLRVADAPASLIEVLLPPRRLIVIGATPVGAALAGLARAADIPVSVVEPRQAYADGLIDADVRLLRMWPDEAWEQIRPDTSCAVAVVAHDERIDVPALAGALAAGCSFVGLLGGGRTRESRRAALVDAGFSESQVARISAPIGLDIGAERPEEVAVAILAEIIGVWRGA